MLYDCKVIGSFNERVAHLQIQENVKSTLDA